MNAFARRGAAVRLAEIEEEARAILAAFPELHRADLTQTPAEDVQGRSLHEIVEGDRRRRPRMSAAERRAVSERMKKYWAARRKA
jgi:hypothetical protein